MPIDTTINPVNITTQSISIDLHGERELADLLGEEGYVVFQATHTMQSNWNRPHDSALIKVGHRRRYARHYSGTTMVMHVVHGGWLQRMLVEWSDVTSRRDLIAGLYADIRSGNLKWPDLTSEGHPEDVRLPEIILNWMKDHFDAAQPV
jgi:hypothetical protein